MNDLIKQCEYTDRHQCTGRAIAGTDYCPLHTNTDPLIGRWVTIRGGFEDGTTGYVTGSRPHVTANHPVYTIEFDDGYSGITSIGGLDAARLEPLNVDRCPYCGYEDCHGSPLTADGADIDRYYRHHPRTRIPRYQELPTPPNAAELAEWPRTPYCEGQRAQITGERRDHPKHYRGGAMDGGAGEWYTGYDDATRGRYYGANAAGKVVEL